MSFVGTLTAFDRKANSETASEEDTVVEVVEAKRSGFVEIAFNDRNERVYLTFDLGQLVVESLAAVTDG